MSTTSWFFAAARAAGVGYLVIKSWKTGMATAPRVLLRNITAIKS